MLSAAYKMQAADFFPKNRKEATKELEARMTYCTKTNIL